MEFVNFEIAKKLKEKGFKKPCFATYDNDGMLGYVYYQPQSIHCVSFDNCLYYGDDVIVAPTISQVLKWLREEKKIAINIEFIPYTWQYKVIDMSFERRFEQFGITLFSDYEEAAIAGIEYCLNNLI